MVGIPAPAALAPHRIQAVLALLCCLASDPLSATVPVDVPQVEYEALMALYHATGGPGWMDSTNWGTDTVGGWNGVTVEGGHVTRLYLQDNWMAGPIPAELGDLASLQWLNLSDNRLTGPIPAELGKLADIQWIGLSNNQLT